MSGGFSVERDGYISVPKMMGDIIGDMVANGFTIQWTNKTEVTWSSTTIQDADMFKIIMQAGPTVDPLNTTQPWNIMFSVNGYQSVSCAVASPIQLTSTGVIATIPQAMNSNLPSEWVGVIGSEQSAQKVNGPGTDLRPYRLVDRSSGSIAISTPADAASRPMSYRLTITSRGIALYIWEEGVAEDGHYASWVVIQRPVDRDTGVTLTTGKCPLFCVYSLYGVITKFVVREADITRPSPSVLATVDTVDSNWIINDQQQVAIAENNTYVTTFPSRLNTGRYAYTNVLDLICTTSADVVANFTQVPITVFGEASPRTYTAMTANGNYNTNMRVLVLTQGGGI